MNKYFKNYVIVWGILLVMFNACAFLIPNYMMNFNKYGPSFWILYGFITVAFIGQLACSYIAFQANGKEKLFLNIPILKISYSTLVTMVIIGIICIEIPAVPYWLSIIACILTLGFNAISVVGAKTASDMVSDIDSKIKADTFFIKSLTIDAETLTSRATSAEAIIACKKVYEAVRYSDPMTNPALAGAESEITLKFNELKNAVLSDDKNVSELANELIILIEDRNRKCILLK